MTTSGSRRPATGAAAAPRVCVTGRAAAGWRRRGRIPDPDGQRLVGAVRDRHLLETDIRRPCARAARRAARAAAIQSRSSFMAVSDVVAAHIARNVSCVNIRAMSKPPIITATWPTRSSTPRCGGRARAGPRPCRCATWPPSSASRAPRLIATSPTATPCWPRWRRAGSRRWSPIYEAALDRRRRRPRAAARPPVALSSSSPARRPGLHRLMFESDFLNRDAAAGGADPAPADASYRQLWRRDRGRLSRGRARLRSSCAPLTHGLARARLSRARCGRTLQAVHVRAAEPRGDGRGGDLDRRWDQAAAETSVSAASSRARRRSISCTQRIETT